jgi:glycosyltransferase involved in cell wall biosynthesis
VTVASSGPTSGSTRVVHICKVKGIAGAERHLLQLLPALAERGVDARMLVLEDPAAPARGFCEALQRSGIPVETLRTPRHVDPLLASRIASRLRQAKPDLVHTHLFHADLYGLAAARRACIRAAVSSRHDNNPFRRRALVRWLTRRAMRNARRIIAISHALARFVRDVEGADEASIVPVHYGLRVEGLKGTETDQARAALGSRPGERVIGFVGRLIEQKGVDVLLDAFPRIREQHPEAALVIVGDGPLRRDLHARAERLGPGVRFAGWIDQAVRTMAACDIVVMPSRWEGLGLVALEALACARPLVASDVDALPEIVRNRETGLLVPPGDPSALAAAVVALLNEPGWAASLGEAGREDVRDRFSIERMARATLDVYATVLAETGGRLRTPDKDPLT